MSYHYWSVSKKLKKSFKTSTTWSRKIHLSMLNTTTCTSRPSHRNVVEQLNVSVLSNRRKNEQINTQDCAETFATTRILCQQVDSNNQNWCTWKRRIIVQINPSVSRGFPSTMSWAPIFSKWTRISFRKVSDLSTFSKQWILILPFVGFGWYKTYSAHAILSIS